MDKYAGYFSKFLDAIKNNKVIRKVLDSNVAVKSKEGIVNSWHSNFGKGLILGAGFITASVYAEFLHDILREKYNIYQSKKHLQNILKEHPQLKEFPPEQVAKYYRSLYHFAPTVAKDPLAAGAYLTQSLKKLSSEELGGPPPDTFNTLSDIEKKVRDSRNSVNNSARRIFEGVATGAVRSAFSGDI